MSFVGEKLGIVQNSSMYFFACFREQGLSQFFIEVGEE